MSQSDCSALKRTLGLRYIRVQFEHGWWAMFFDFVNYFANYTPFNNEKFIVCAIEDYSNP